MFDSDETTEISTMQNAGAGALENRPWQRLRIRVPREDQTVFAVPPVRDGWGVARKNQQIFADASEIDIQGRTLAQLRHWSRRSVLEAAREYTSGWVNAAELPDGALEFDTIFVGGHQPGLFHPGVWAKNFALGALARSGNAIGLNLVVDNDTCASTSIRVPAGTRSHPVLASLPFDARRPVQPWEDVRVLDRELFEGFADRAAEAMRPWGIEPVIQDLWPVAVEHLATSDRIADCLTAARNRQERTWGVANLELPISRLCTLDPFLWFTGHLLAHLPRFREIHNEVLRDYRRINRVRSRTHPVADLREKDGWHEGPFWIWRSGDLQRSRLFARQVEREVHLSAGDGIVLARLPLTPEGEACCAVEALRDMQQSGIHLRTRALSTTLFSRICLADLFLHGIGGAKYDEMTDRIICRFFDLPAPGFMTISATLHLPLEPYPVTPADEVRLRRLLRDLELNPEQHLNPGADPAVEALVSEEQRLIAEQTSAPRVPGRSARKRGRLERFERFQRLRELKSRLAERTAPERTRVTDERDSVLQQLQANSVLQDREFSFGLYPAAKLRSFLSRIDAG